MKTKYSLLWTLFISLMFLNAVSAQPCTISSNAFMNNICSGSSVTLTVSCNPGISCQWSWYPNAACSGSPLTGGSGNSITVSPGTTTTYSVSDNCASGCISSITILVNSTAPTAGISTSVLPRYACPGTTVSSTWIMSNVARWIRFWDTDHLGLTFDNITANSGTNPPWEVVIPATGTGQVIQIILPASGNSSGNWPFWARVENACGNSGITPKNDLWQITHS